MAGRRMLLIVAVLMGLVAVAVSVAPTPRVATVRTGEPPVPTAPRAEPPAGTQTADGAVLGELSAAGSDQVVRIAVGRRARIRVVARKPVTVQIGDDGPIAVADAGSPAEFELLPDAPLDSEVVLLESGRVIGRVKAAR